jgi:broad specificity phosphatase PhoE
MTTRLFLIRHGVTRWNTQRKYCGHGDVGLSLQGKNQAARLARKMKTLSIDKVYASDRKRAIQTARIAFGDARISLIPDLKEIHFGCLEGLTHDQALKKYPVAYKNWLKDPFRHAMPGSERMASFGKRISGAIKMIARKNRGRNVAIVCHGGTIAVFAAALKKTREFWRLVPGSASLSVVEYKNACFKLKCFNRTDHL